MYSNSLFACKYLCKQRLCVLRPDRTEWGLANAFEEAWMRGPTWRQTITAGAARLPHHARALLATTSGGRLSASDQTTE